MSFYFLAFFIYTKSESYKSVRQRSGIISATLEQLSAGVYSNVNPFQIVRNINGSGESLCSFTHIRLLAGIQVTVFGVI